MVFWDRENGLNFVGDLTKLAKLMELVENAHSGGVMRSLSAHSIYYINWGTEAEFPFLRNFGESQFMFFFS